MQYCGTAVYMSPELFMKKSYDHKVDNFAFGTLLWEIFANQVPWDGLDPSDISSRVIKNEPLSMISISNKELKSLIIDCRDQSPKLRPEFDEILKRLTSIKESS